MKHYKAIYYFLFALIFLTAFSCKKFLDIVPDDVATIDHAFRLRNEAEKYLFTCYSYLPQDGNEHYNVGMLGGDEMWIPYQTAITSYAFEIARGNQRISNSYFDAWVGNYEGGGPGDSYNLFHGIRQCNTFIENMKDPNQVPDITASERRRWIGEAEFLKAYYHYYLLRMYGPIPIIDKNLPVDAPEDDVRVKRLPVDSCVNYIANLLDSAAAKLPALITDNVTEAGRVTKSVALGIKAKLLVMAASPLFNGNTDFSGFVNQEGKPFFNQTYDVHKWEKAAAAAKVAIDSAESMGCKLYEFTQSPFELTDTTMTQLSIRQAVCERWNSEIIWGNPNSLTSDLQLQCMAPLVAGDDPNNAHMIMSAPLKIAELFYTKNGVPLNEDKTLDFSDLTAMRTATHDERFNIGEGYQTARLNFDREPRFYADLGFDGGVWYMYSSPTNSDEGTYVLNGKYGNTAGARHAFFFNVTGYYIKKLVDWNHTMSSSGATYKAYPWPELRLADVYLLYAEAMNEAYGPSSDIYTYLDKIRSRAGLKGIEESWDDFSNNPSEYKTQVGLRKIIHQERGIEMAFEGSRFWDLRRWKEAAKELNQPITGWNIYGSDAPSYFQISTVYQQTFVAPRDYFWPIPEDQIIKNPNLVQNVGWQ